MKMRRAVTICLLACAAVFGFGCAKTPGGGLTVPHAEFLQDYDAWGQQTNFQRDHDFMWKDRSNWHDGKSRLAPNLPLPTSQHPTGTLTCAQEEVLWLMTFPKTERLLRADTTQAERDRATQRWEAAFTTKVWRDHSPPTQWTGLSYFQTRCGDLTPPM